MSTDDAASPSARGVLVTLLVAQAMATMDGSIVAVATKTIRDQLHASDAALQVILSGYTLAFAVLVVTGARLGKDLGHAKVFRVGIIGFGLASLICGLAPNAAVLVVGRAVQGAFGALMVPQVLSLIQLVFTGKARARAIGLYSMILALGVAAGQILGGLVVGANLLDVGWRAAFLINVPVGIALLLLSRTSLPGHVREGTFRPDAAGIAFLAVSMIAVVGPLIFGREQGWPVWALVVLPIGLIGLVGFFLFERRLAGQGGQPVLEVDALRPAGVKAGLLACCILNFGFAGIVFPMTLHMQAGLGYTPLQAGLMFVPMPIGFAAVSLTWTKLPERLHSLLPLAGLGVFAAAVFGLGAVARGHWTLPLVALCLLFAGAGMAAGFSTLVDQTATAVGPKYAAALSAMVSTGTLLASVFAVATIGGIYVGTTGDDLALSGEGLGRALFANGAVLLVGLGLAVRTWYVARAASASPVAVPAAEAA
jgi:MFS family permease